MGKKRKTFQKLNGSKGGKKGERSESILMVSSYRAERTREREHQTVSVPHVREIVGLIHPVEDDHLRGKKKSEYQHKPARLRERKQKKQEKE